MFPKKILIPLLVYVAAFGQTSQWVEGFERIDVHQNPNGPVSSRDFRGVARGYMTVPWWTHGDTPSNFVSWQTAVLPAKQSTVFAFIGATAVLPSEFSRGPKAKLFVNGTYALTFSIGFTRDVTWSGSYWKP